VRGQETYQSLQFTIQYLLLMNITIKTQGNTKRVVADRVIDRAIRAALRYERLYGTLNTGRAPTINILWCGRTYIRRLNGKFRSTNRVTDVLSFPDAERDSSGGDIALCASKVRLQAKEYGHSLKREASYLAVHSALHLMGYDHETAADKRVMRAHEDEIMRKLRINIE
jgi:probable rRNA maturation factor